MDISTTARRFAPLAGILAGTAVLGAAASWGAIRAAGDSDALDTGQGMTLLSTLGSFPVATGGVAGIASWQVFGRVKGGSLIPGQTGWMLMPAAIGGAWIGARIARGQLERAHQPEYETQRDRIDTAMEATRDVLRGAGVDEDLLERVPERYDRSYFNASYQVPLGPLRNNIVVGRHPTTGVPFATTDVVAHEFTHKVLHAYAPGLSRPGPGGDGGAIHESIADTFAVAVDTDDWLIGEDVVPGGMRSFSHPEVRGAYRDGEIIPAPITREQLKRAEVHLGAGVGNKAAWRIGDALGRDVMLRIYVAALERRELGWRSSYDDLATAVRGAATDMYGPTSREAQVVDDAWRQAGY